MKIYKDMFGELFLRLFVRNLVFPIEIVFSPSNRDFFHLYSAFFIRPGVESNEKVNLKKKVSRKLVL